MSESKKLKQAKHKEKTQEEIQNIIRSRKIAKEKGISKKDLRRMRLNKTRMRLEKKMKESSKIKSYEDSVRIMTFGTIIDSYTKKILDDYHNDYHNDTLYSVMNSWKQQEKQRMTRLEMIAQQFDEYEETSPYYNSYHDIDGENFHDIESNHGDFGLDWMLHQDNQSK